MITIYLFWNEGEEQWEVSDDGGDFDDEIFPGEESKSEAEDNLNERIDHYGPEARIRIETYN